MRKTIVIIAAIILIPLLIAFLYFNTFVKNLIESKGTEIAGAPVSIGFVAISPLSGEFSIHELQIKNPSGFKSDSILKLGSLNAKIDIGTLLKDTIIINHLELAEPQITYEIGSKGSNIQALQTSIKQHNNKTKNTAKTNDNSAGNAKKVIIKDLHIKQGQIKLHTGFLKNADTAGLTIPDIHLQNIGKEQNGVLFSQAATQILKPFSEAITKANINKIKNQAEEIGKELKGKVDKLKSLFN